MGTGTAEVSSNTRSENSARIDPNSATSDRSTNPTAGAGGPYLNSVQSNPLEKYASFSALWTLACLSPVQYNNPQSYRSTGQLDNVILSSAGRYDQERTKTASGSPAYYIDDVRITSMIMPTPALGNSYASKFTFTVYEPYSMGLFLQSLQTAARLSRYPDYHAAPFVLKLEYAGYNSIGSAEPILNDPSITPKYFVIKITKASFSVNEGGSQYEVEAVPFNHSGLDDVETTIYNDMSFSSSGDGTVADALTGESSLVSALNAIEENLVKNKKIKVADVYDIQFPTTADFFNQETITDLGESATVSLNQTNPISVGGNSRVSRSEDLEINPIGAASFGFSQNTGGNYPFLDESAEITESGAIRRNGLVIDPTTRQFQFSQGQNIRNIIERVINSSTYTINAQNPENKINGFILYYRIDVQTEFLEFDDLIGDYAKKITFRIVPYYVHESIAMNANAVPSGYKEIENQVIKHYRYIYTGQNVDVLNFEIKINNLFYTGFQPTPEIQNADNQNRGKSGPSPDEAESVSTGEGNSPGAIFNNIGRRRILPDPELLKEKSAGGLGEKNIAVQVAEAFHHAFITGQTADLVTVDLEILGDPYWLSDSGFANYFSKPTGVLSQITQDGTMNYEAGQIFVYLTFRSPTDIDETSGLYNFSEKQTVSPFSGIYRVTQVTSEFSGGQFTQQIRCIRMIGQSLDFDTETSENRTTNDQQTSLFKINTPSLVKVSPISDDAYISGFWDDN